MTALNKELKEMQALGVFDGLTGVYTRPFAQRLIHYESSISLALIDVDGLKALNDGAGHRAGDQALLRISAALSARFQQNQIVARWGGDEFLIFDPEGRDLAPGLQACLQDLADQTSKDGPETIITRFSYGVAWGREADNLAAALELADQRLYAHKAKKSRLMASQ